MRTNSVGTINTHTQHYDELCTGNPVNSQHIHYHLFNFFNVLLSKMFVFRM